ncbi:hypothetical protein [Chelatococcus asaccharovorans]|uniref:Glycosyl transferase family 1 n=1 Tax=Chelatococcus asaccharovorans TaxID=28210 RepID=A0A2V3U817_9HYPH|nr:hypothetical protein [Chelatococcus asaccharovorans]MBS7705915.1 hypothetical protein [Chelatococcus asaccharovorans]PXW58936.1 hypothetical protein C7450_105285 [Chelatococcus asaccharovorans]
MRPAPGETLVVPVPSILARWLPDEPVIVTGATTALGRSIDLAALPLPTGGERIRNLRIGHGVHLPYAIRLTAGDVMRLPFTGGQVELLSHPLAGKVRIDAADCPPLIVTLDDTTARPVGTGPAARAVRAGQRRTSARQLRLKALESALDRHIATAMAAPTQSDAQAVTLALYTPRWRGPAAATVNLFNRALPIPVDDSHPEDLSAAEIETCAARIAYLPIDRLVMSGCDPSMRKLVEAIRRRRPIATDLLWHSSFLQMGEPADWGLLQMWLDAASAGHIRRIGVVKKGLDGFLRSLGFDAAFVQNRVAVDPAGIRPTDARDSAGIWLSGSSHYRKLPYATLCALSELRHITVSGAGFDSRALALIEELGLRIGEISPDPLRPGDLRAALRKTAITLSITTSECLPMLPLESLAEGVPCLIGPSCHLFRDHPELRAVYVADRPGQPHQLAGKIRDALAATGELFPKLTAYMTAWNEASVASVDALICGGSAHRVASRRTSV